MVQLVLLTVEIPQLPLYKVVHFNVMQVVHFVGIPSCRRCCSPFSRSLRFRSCCTFLGGRCHCCAELEVPGAVVEETVEIPPSLLIENIVVSWCRRGEDSRDLTVATVEKIAVSRTAWTRLSTCPLACRRGQLIVVVMN